jgi:hypothetical protein
LDALIQEIKKLYTANLYSSNFRVELPAPATHQQIEAAEQRLGFDLSKLVRELYLEIGNGGFGPGCRFLEEGIWQGLGYSIERATEIYLRKQQAFDLWGVSKEWNDVLRGLFPICDGGCQYHFMVDCNIENGPMIQYEGSGFLSKDAFTLVAPTLRDWLEEWLNDEESQSWFDIPYSTLK